MVLHILPSATNHSKLMCKKSPGFSVLHRSPPSTRKKDLPQPTTSFLSTMLSLTRIGLLSQKLALTPALVRGIKTIPQPPGFIVGTVNDAYVPPKPDKKHGSLHWTTERAVAIGLLPLVASSFASSPSVLLDTTLSAFVLYHSYTGFQSCITDYIPERVYGSYHNYAMYLLTFGTGVAGYGIYSLEQKEEGGVAGIISKLWHA